MSIIEKINGWHPILLSAVALGIGMTDVNEYLKGIIYVVTIGYMIWKWVAEVKKNKSKKR